MQHRLPSERSHFREEGYAAKLEIGLAGLHSGAELARHVDNVLPPPRDWASVALDHLKRVDVLVKRMIAVGIVSHRPLLDGIESHLLVGSHRTVRFQINQKLSRVVIDHIKPEVSTCGVFVLLDVLELIRHRWQSGKAIITIVWGDLHRLDLVPRLAPDCGLDRSPVRSRRRPRFHQEIGAVTRREDEMSDRVRLGEIQAVHRDLVKVEFSQLEVDVAINTDCRIEESSPLDLALTDFDAWPLLTIDGEVMGVRAGNADIRENGFFAKFLEDEDEVFAGLV